MYVFYVFKLYLNKFKHEIAIKYTLKYILKIFQTFQRHLVKLKYCLVSDILTSESAHHK